MEKKRIMVRKRREKGEEINARLMEEWKRGRKENKRNYYMNE